MDGDEDKPFEGMFGNSCEIKMFEYLLSCPNFDFNISELGKIIGISRSSANTIVKRFLKWGILEKRKKRPTKKLLRKRLPGEWKI